jgi:hypothetical protein
VVFLTGLVAVPLASCDRAAARRRAARFTTNHALRPAHRPDPGTAGRKRRTPTGATGLAPDHSPASER